MDDKKHGRGINTLNDGTRFKGEWHKNNLFEDSEFKYPNGDVYNGRHSNGHKQGYGVMNYKTGDTYSGHWENN